MPVRMKHPEHGYHLCYTPEDVRVHMAIGWVPEEPENTAKPPQPERKKPGRKPKVKHGD